MKHLVNSVMLVNPWVWILLGMICLGCSMMAFAAVTWPEAFYGILGTFAP